MCYRFWYYKKSIGKLKSADGLVVGSEICKQITNSLKKGQNPVTNVSKSVISLEKRNYMNWINKIKNLGQSIKKILIRNFLLNLREIRVHGQAVARVLF